MQIASSNLPTLLKQIRAQLHLTQTELANELGVSFSTRDNPVIICSIHFAASKAEEVKEISLIAWRKLTGDLEEKFMKRMWHLEQ